jgi:hypothetical protein
MRELRQHFRVQLKNDGTTLRKRKSKPVSDRAILAFSFLFQRWRMVVE